MAGCAYCGSTILFGGKKLDGLKFCSDKCLSKGQILIAARDVPNDVVLKQAQKVHSGPCPVCKEQRGPVDVYTSHKVASFFVMTSWSSTPRVSCRSCGTKAQLGATFYSLLLGWWGLPWGLIMTPVQIIKNVAGMVSGEAKGDPSDQLNQMVRNAIASQVISGSQRVQR